MATRKSPRNQSADAATAKPNMNCDCRIPPAECESIHFQSCRNEHMVMEEVVHNDDDFLDAIVMAEEGFQDRGYKEGFSLGKRSGFEQGRQTGHVKGREVGSEVGFYLGFVTAWKALLEKEEDRNKLRVTKALESLLSMLQKFPVDNPNHEGLWDDLKKIRAKFKQVASLVKISINASDDDGGSNTKPAMSF